MSNKVDMRQLIIARKDLGMSPGKLAAQVSHASMCWLFALIPLIALSVRFADWWDDWIERKVGRREDDDNYPH